MGLLDLSEYDVVLGSSSERRLSILKDILKVPYMRTIKPSFEENLSKELAPEIYVAQTSQHKLKSVLEENVFSKPTIVICCDTIVVCNGTILEKPVTKERQKEMLLSYKRYPQLKAISALLIAKVDTVHEPQTHFKTVTTKLNFDSDISDDILRAYIDSEEGLQVAGGFKFQETGNLLFLSIEGDYFNIVGLPAKDTFQIVYNLLHQ